MDVLEYEGRTYLFYATGDQERWGSVRAALYLGPLSEFYPRHFPPGAPRVRVRARP